MLLEVLRKDRERLKLMTYYCTTKECLRTYILKYFGETGQAFCGNCGNCNDCSEEIDITTQAQKILSGIKRAGERFGIKMTIDILRGSQSIKILNANLNKLSTYGIMQNDSEVRIREIIDFLLTAGYILSTSDEYPVLRLTVKANKVLLGKENLKMRLRIAEEKRIKPQIEDANIDTALFIKLKELRAKIAKIQSVPAFVIFSDATLRDMCVVKPKRNQNY